MKSAFLIMLAVGMMLPVFAGRLQITNSTGGYSIWYVYISPTSADSWGNDWLGSSETISSGYSKTFTVPNGSYDVKLIDEDGDEYIVWNMPISGTVTWNVTLDYLGERNWGGGSTPSSVGNAPVTIHNALGSYDIYYIYCDPSDMPWGQDRLGSSILSPGRSTTFNVPANNYYDIKCVDVDGDTYTLWEIWIGTDGFHWNVDLSYID